MSKFWQNFLSGWASTLSVYPLQAPRYRFVRRATTTERMARHWNKVGIAIKKASRELEKRIASEQKASGRS